MSDKKENTIAEILLEGVKEINFPKQLMDKSEQLLKTLFGESFQEIGGMFADNIKLRRFKNQVKILEKAQQILKEKKLDPKSVPLKILAPLINESSLEEEELLQDKWANLIASVVSNDNNVLLELNCIEILKKISVKEAQILDWLYDTVLQGRIERFDRLNKRRPNFYKTLEEINLSSILFRKKSIVEKFKISKANLDDYISNLISFGVIDYDVPDISVEAQKSYEEPDDLDIDVEVVVSKTNYLYLTNLGLKFIETCRSEK